MVTLKYSKEDIFNMLSFIPDPEIPVVSIKEIGMLRDVILTENGYEIILTPTYTGCPAMGIIEEDILKVLNGNGVSPVKVKLVYSPAWTTDWMSKEAKEKMRMYGIAPPIKSACNKWVEFGKSEMIKCPYCNSLNTSVISQFGSTACKALYKCDNCKEPFEYFKCH
jgi:ring-1,2-phenylacetyl-CoA epoxidase subunit PaaD